MRVYLDICAIQRPLDDQTQLRVRTEAEAILGVLTLCESGALDLVSSAAHVIENGKNPHPERRAHVDDVLALTVLFVPTDDEVLRHAQRFERAGMRQLDALHLAAAVVSGSEFFCTTDDRLLRKGQVADTNATAIVSPLELVVQLNQTPDR